jgi:hypothetical protein
VAGQIMAQRDGIVNFQPRNTMSMHVAAHRASASGHVLI